MNFNSLTFLIFLPIVTALYWLFPHKLRWILLLAASYFFYMSWSAKLALLILTTTVTAFCFALLMERTRKKKIKTLWLVFTLIICLGLLVFFKYADFLIGSVISLLNFCGMSLSDFSLHLLLPVGISFYTFQTLSYVIDVYRGEVQAEKHFGYFALYVSYFPQLVAGPIERPENLLPQLKKKQTFSSEDMAAGLRLLLSGFIRKCVIADFCGLYVDRVYADLNGSTSLAIALASLLFLVQMYNDFAGYSEIALGSARLMGVKLSKNFDRPLLSKSYTEFFRRWHITLNQWFTQYVYIPLGGNRKGKARKIFNTLVVFLLCGLWHGANWTFVLWGAFAGVIVCVETMLKKPSLKLLSKLKISPDDLAVVVLRRTFMWILFLFSCVLFRAPNISEVGTAFTGLFTRTGISGGYFTESFARLGLEGGKLLFLLLAIVVMAYLPRLTDEDGRAAGTGSDPERVRLQTPSFTSETAVRFLFGVLAVAFLWFAILSETEASGFRYFQF